MSTHSDDSDVETQVSSDVISDSSSTTSTVSTASISADTPSKEKEQPSKDEGDETTDKDTPSMTLSGVSHGLDSLAVSVQKDKTGQQTQTESAAATQPKKVLIASDFSMVAELNALLDFDTPSPDASASAPVSPNAQAEPQPKEQKTRTEMETFAKTQLMNNPNAFFGTTAADPSSMSLAPSHDGETNITKFQSASNLARHRAMSKLTSTTTTTTTASSATKPTQDEQVTHRQAASLSALPPKAASPESEKDAQPEPEEKAAAEPEAPAKDESKEGVSGASTESSSSASAHSTTSKAAPSVASAESSSTTTTPSVTPETPQCVVPETVNRSLTHSSMPRKIHTVPKSASFTKGSSGYSLTFVEQNIKSLPKHHRTIADLFKRTRSTVAEDSAELNSLVHPGDVSPTSAKGEGAGPLVFTRLSPVHTQLRPWLRDNCVSKHTAACLVDHGVTLETLGTVTDDELREMGLESLVERTHLYSAMWFGKVSITNALSQKASDGSAETQTTTESASAGNKQEDKQSTEEVQDDKKDQSEDAEPKDEEKDSHSSTEHSKDKDEKSESDEDEKDEKDEEEQQEEQKEAAGGDENVEETTRSAQSLLRTMLLSSWFNETLSNRYKEAKALAEFAKSTAGEYAVFHKCVVDGAPRHLFSEDEKSVFSAILAMENVWKELAASLAEPLRFWNKTVGVGDALCKKVSLNWWTASFHLYFVLRGRMTSIAIRLAEQSKVAKHFKRAHQQMLAEGVKVDPIEFMSHAVTSQLDAFSKCIEQVREYTNFDHDDYPKLTLVLTRIKELQDIDDRTAVADDDKMDDLKHLREEVAKMRTPPSDLVIWGRKLLRQGTFHEHVSAKNPSFRWSYVLLSDRLLLGTHDEKHNIFQCMKVIKLIDIKGISPVYNDSEVPSGVKANMAWVYVLDGVKHIMFCNDVSERRTVVDALKKAVNDNRVSQERTRAEFVSIRAQLNS